jgi:mono/diheme cytochrome c family protein
LRKIIAGAGLVLVALAMLLSLFFFWRENWGANQTPGAVEQFLARLVLASTRRAEAELPNPIAPTEENLRTGQALYEKQCAFCHGLDGSGPAESRVQFYPPVPSLSQPDNELTDAQAHGIIRRGIRYTAMPSFERALSEEESWQVVLWLRQLQRTANPNATPGASDSAP